MRNKLTLIKIIIIFIELILIFAFTGYLSKVHDVKSQTNLPELPSFRLPYPENMNGKVFFTGGPHQYELGGNFSGQYDYSQGTGIDFAGNYNNKSFPVLTMASGWITKASCIDNRYFGCSISIKHDIGTTYLTYAHLDPNSKRFLEINSILSQGKSIWVPQGTWIGNTGCSGDGAKRDGKCIVHLHIELRNNSEYGEKLDYATFFL